MTTQEVFDNLEKSLTGKANVDIVGQPHTVPHGGIAIDARICNGNNYSINCFETYGTDELLSDLESILTKENV